MNDRPFILEEKEGLSLMELCVEKGEAEYVQRLTDLGVRGDLLNPLTGHFIKLFRIFILYTSLLLCASRVRGKILTPCLTMLSM